MSDYSGVALSISDEVKAAMESKGILEAEIKEAIGPAEETGAKLRDEDGTKFLAKLKIADTFFYAEYQPAGDGFEVLDAYCHKTWVTGW
jgi:hypothetical protein